MIKIKGVNKFIVILRPYVWLILRYILLPVPGFYLAPLARRGMWQILPRGRNVVKDNYLGKFRISINTYYNMERKICRGLYHKDIQRLISMLCKQGDVCFDIGAHVGAISMAMADAVKDDGKVYAFEPGPYYTRLVRNLEMNPEVKKIIIPVNKGLGDRSMEAYWKEDKRNRGNGTLLPIEQIGAKAADLDKGVRVDIITLDDFLSDNYDINRVDFIKVDVEGMEYEVLLGARECLKKYKPAVIFESHIGIEELLGLPVLKYIQGFLESMGYTLYQFDKDKLFKEIKYPDFPHDTIAVYGSMQEYF